MNMFARHLQQNVTSNVTQEEPDVVIAPGGDSPVVDPNDSDPLAPVITDDEFAQQRARRNADHGFAGIENFQQSEEINGTPVDGTDDDQSVTGADTDVKLPEGEFGEEPEKTEKGNDVDVDADDTEVEFDNSADQTIDQDLDQFEQEEGAIETLGREIQMLSDSSIAIERFGMNPTTMGVMQATGLLSSTALESMALESVSFSSGKDAESQMALEAIGEKIKETAAKWSAKVLSVVKDGSTKILSVLEPIYTKISKTVSALVSKSWDGVKAAGATVKAHPVKTILGVIAAIAAVAGVVVFVTQGAPSAGAKIDVMRSYMTKVAEQINKIKWPFGKVKASADGMKLLTHYENSFESINLAHTKTIGELGWSQSAAKASASQLERAWDAIKKSWAALGERGMKLAKGTLDVVGDIAVTTYKISKGAQAAAEHTASKVFGNSKAGQFASGMVGAHAGNLAGAGYLSAWTGIITALFKLTRFIVVGGFRLIAATLRKLLSVVNGGSAEPAAA